MDHIPVLLKEVIEVLEPSSGEFFIDGTVGGGGHTAEIAKRIAPGGKLLCIDRDPLAIERARQRSYRDVETIFVGGNYADIPEILARKKLGRADGVLLDLGFSSFQIEDVGRGFSFMKNGPLDMRYGKEGMTAADVVNGSSREKLADIFWKYGEERSARRIASAIVEERKKKRIMTTGELAEIIERVLPRHRIHAATRVFQALRIYVNGELENLEKFLKHADRIAVSGGRIAIISFHSLEDRLVKTYFKTFAGSGKATLITKKPIRTSRDELSENPRSRSAKLRAIKFI